VLCSEVRAPKRVGDPVAVTEVAVLPLVTVAAALTEAVGPTAQADTLQPTETAVAPILPVTVAVGEEAAALTPQPMVAAVER
jgi:hypothetical protein